MNMLSAVALAALIALIFSLSVKSQPRHHTYWCHVSAEMADGRFFMFALPCKYKTNVPVDV